MNNPPRSLEISSRSILLGAHMSIRGGVYNAIDRGKELGCNTIQMFTRNANQWNSPPLDDEDIRLFHEALVKTPISPIFAHDSYLVNLASPMEPLRLRSISALSEELNRCARLGIPYLVIHPGSHRGSGEDEGLRRVAASLSKILNKMDNDPPTVLLEITAGQGTSLGYTFEHLARLRENIDGPVEICFDTCHAFAAGYDLRTAAAYEKTFDRFDSIIGMQHLKLIHLNDSLRSLGSGVDRHHHIGEGQLGLETFRMIMNDPRFQNVPKIIETPKEKNGEDMDRINLRTLRAMVEK